MKGRIRQGLFEVIESFAIIKKNEFYLLGKITEGIVNENWFINIPLNGSLAMTIRISEMEDIKFSSEKEDYKLVIIKGNAELIDFLLALKISSEFLDITIEGED